jgi:dethiobiotin synthetase
VAAKVTRTAVFIAGAHTDVGKTYVACALIAAARRQGLSVEALKPVVSGFDAADWTVSDPGRLLGALGRPRSQEALDAMSPWRFAAPLAPPMAAKLEGRPLPLPPIADFCHARRHASQADLLLVEGVGGLMSPIADRATGLDLMEALGLPTVLVGGAYLGAISHLLTALETLRSRGRAPLAVIVSEGADPAAPDFKNTVESVRELAGDLDVIAAPRTGRPAWPGELVARLASGRPLARPPTAARALGEPTGIDEAAQRNRQG